MVDNFNAVPALPAGYKSIVIAQSAIQARRLIFWTRSTDSKDGKLLLTEITRGYDTIRLILNIENGNR